MGARPAHQMTYASWQTARSAVPRREATMAATRGAKKAPAKSPKSRGVAKKPKAAKAKAATKAKAAPAAGGAADVTVERCGS